MLCPGLLGLLLLTQWNWFAMPFERDEGEYAYSAWIMKDGGVPYRDAFLQKPPMVVYTYLAAQQLSETATWPPRLLAFGFVLLTLGLVAWISRQEYGSRCGWIGAWLFVPMMAFPALSSAAANTEKFMNLPMMAVLALHVRGKGKPTPWVWMAAGACAALAMLYKPICSPLLLFVFSAWAVEVAQGNRRWSPVLRFGACAASGGLLATFLVLLFFIRHEALGALWEATVVYNRAYAEITGWNPRAFLHQARTFLVGWWPLAFALAWFCGGAPRRGWYWTVLLLLAGAVAYKDPNQHYYVMAVPIGAIMAARGLVGFGDWLQQRWAVDWHAEVAATAVVGLLLPVAPWMTLSPAALAKRLYGANPFAESPVVARELAELTAPGERVYVAGSEPQILFYAKRRSATRFVIAYPLMIPTRFARPYQREVIQALRDRPPEAIVVSSVSTSWSMHPLTAPHFIPFLQDFLETRYQPVGRYVQDGKEGAWLSSATPAAQGAESLVLYRRNE